MRLFDLIYRASIENDTHALWEILTKYQPLINNNSKKLFSSEIDEDLRSEQLLVLARRIKHFDIYKQW